GSEHENGFQTQLVGLADLQNITRQLAGARIALGTYRADLLDLFFVGRGRNTFREDADHAGVLPRALVAADDVVIERGLDVPAGLPGQLREVSGAIQALLLAGHGQEDRSEERRVGKECRARWEGG